MRAKERMLLMNVRKGGGKQTQKNEQHISSLAMRYAMDVSKSLNHVRNVALLNVESTATMMITPSHLMFDGYVAVVMPGFILR